MIKWQYEQMDMFRYWFEIKDEYGNNIYPYSIISAPAMSILKEMFTDYAFAKEINKTDKIFDMDYLSPEDKMELKVVSIHKLEDADNDN